MELETVDFLQLDSPVPLQVKPVSHPMTALELGFSMSSKASVLEIGSQIDSGRRWQKLSMVGPGEGSLDHWACVLQGLWGP